MRGERMATPKTLRYELWVRIECPERSCKQWTSLPWRGLPKTARCVGCGAVLEIAKLKEEGAEWRRR